MKRIFVATLITTSVILQLAQAGSSAASARTNQPVASMALTTSMASVRSLAPVLARPLASAVISSRMIILSRTVQAGPPGQSLRPAVLWFSYPADARPTRVGSAVPAGPGRLQLTLRLDAARITPGPNWLQSIDTAGGWRAIELDLRRLSRVAITDAELRPAARIGMAVRVMHYDPKLDRFVPSQLSPVRLQEEIDGRWVTQAHVVSNVLGRARTTFPAGSWRHYYRAVRPEGATVRGATSLIVRVGPHSPAVTLPAGASF